jgi:hypothetical protein
VVTKKRNVLIDVEKQEEEIEHHMEELLIKTPFIQNKVAAMDHVKIFCRSKDDIEMCT